MPFGAYKYRDHVAQVDTGLANISLASVSASTVSQTSSGSPLLMFGSNNFHKVLYRVYVNSAAGQNVQLNMYYWAASSASASSLSNGWSVSSLSSVSSRWSQIDSANMTVSMASSGAVSVSNTILALDFRPEKFSAGWNVILPVVQAWGAASVAQGVTVTGDAYLTDFQPASLFDSATVNVVETDYF